MDIEFIFKDVFNPNDHLSRFILKLAIARNDLFQVHKNLQISEGAPFNPGESFYIFRMGISHLREAYKLIYLFSDVQEINNFVKSLGPENEKRYKDILKHNKEFNQPDSVLSETLKPIRDNSFHYYESRNRKRDFSYESKLIEKLNKLSDMKFNITSTGKKGYQLDYAFASAVSFYLLFGSHITEDDFQIKIKELAFLTHNFIAFSDDAVGYYIFSYKELSSPD